MNPVNVEARMWTELWANELSVDDLRVGHILVFVKAPLAAGDYGLADALISHLDRSPFTHSSLFIGRFDDGPRIAHSTFAGPTVEPLHSAVREQRHAPVFLFTHSYAIESTLAAAAQLAVSRCIGHGTDVNGYPFDDIFLTALLLRLRLNSKFDEHLHRSTAHLFDVFNSAGLGGRMCAAFLAQVFADIGVGIEPPVERSAFSSGFAEVSGIGLPGWAAAALGPKFQGVAALLETSVDDSEIDGSLRAELHEVARDARRADEVVSWLIDGTVDEEPAVVRAFVSLIDSRHAEPPPSDLACRFTTVHDLLRSPTIQPVGHLRNWYER